MFGKSWIRYLSLAAVLPFLSLASAWAGDVTVKLQGNYTVTSGTTRITIPTSWMQEGHAYTLTSAPVSGNLTAYSNPYLQSVVYVDGSTTRRIVHQSRHTPDLGEQVHLQKDMWNTGENKAEFWARCETASCHMKLTVYEREEGTFDRKTFYRDGTEYRVIDGQPSLYKDFYHLTEKNGDYGLQVDYEADRYMYLYRDDNFSTSNVNALSFWIRSGGSIDEDDLTIALTTGNHFLLTSWLPLSDYVTIAASQTWYPVIIPLSDLNPSESSIRGLALMSDRSGLVYLDDVRLSSEELNDDDEFKTCLPPNDVGPFKLCFPLDDYTPDNIPVSAAMDNSIGTKGVITTYDGDEARFEIGCWDYGTGSACSLPLGSYNISTNTDDVLGYHGLNGISFLPDLNYDDGVANTNNTYLFYDEHTGYDFVPAGAANFNVPVYAAEGGTVSYGASSSNEVIIAHRDGYTTHYLHMEDDRIANGATVRKGQRIGTVGDEGADSPHLHVTVKRNGLRLDPYGEDLWE